MTTPYREQDHSARIQWEYTQVRVDSDNLDHTLNWHGEAGWELTSVIRIPPNRDSVYYRLFFKRTK